MKILTIVPLLFLISAASAGHEVQFGRRAGGYWTAPLAAERAAPFPVMNFTQNLDHSDSSNEETWTQKYYENGKYYQADSKTVFLMLGGEGPINEFWMDGGAWVEYAQNYHPYLFQLEHRFYGQSWPTADFSTENLQYLTSQQALADAATFIAAMNKEHNFPDDVKWIAFGGSYSGSLAAWLRMMYPDLVQGAVSSSGPMVAKLDFTEYFTVVFKDLKDIDPKCLDSYVDALNQVDAILTGYTEGNYSVNLNEMFNICGNIADEVDSAQDVSNFFNSLADSVSNVAQYTDNNDGNPVTLKAVCGLLTDTSISQNAIERFAYYYRTQHPTNCVNAGYQALIDFARYPVADFTHGLRTWLYQTCTEFGFFQSTDQNPPVIPNRFPLGFYTQYCRDVFGSEYTDEHFNEMIVKTNNFYGGLQMNASNVVFVQGSVDPWNPLGIKDPVNEDSSAIFIEGTAHVADTYNTGENDVPALTNARKEINRLIGTWVN